MHCTEHQNVTAIKSHRCTWCGEADRENGTNEYDRYDNERPTKRGEQIFPETGT